MLNQRDRICSSILGSEFFKNLNVMYTSAPQGQGNYECSLEEVSFEGEGFADAEAVKIRPEGYYEWMMSCDGQRTDSGEVVQFHVSRAYSMGQVFVYHRPPSSDTMRLLNLSKNVSIADIVSVISLFHNRAHEK